MNPIRIIVFPLLLSGLFLQTTGARAQTIRGMVMGEDSEGRTVGLPGANLVWEGTMIGAATDVEGRFDLLPPDRFPADLVISYVGYSADTVRVSKRPEAPVRFVLSRDVQLGTVQIVEKRQGTVLSTRNTFNVEAIGAKELKRAACCDLSESFETNATVDVSYSDAVTGTKAIRMMGLDGRYAQISVENIPFIRGLSSAYGLTLIPGTWINGINVSKGTGPVVNGNSTITGQIDLDLLKPTGQPPLFVNLYGNSQGRTELNVHAASPVGNKWSTLLMAHGNVQQNEVDNNNDGYLDMPITERMNVLDRWEFHDENRHGQIGLRVVHDDRQSGQVGLRRGEAGGVVQRYGTRITNRMFDLFGKHGWVFENDPTKSIGLVASLRRHEADLTLGERDYTGEEHSAYVNAIFQTLLGDGNDQLKAGITGMVDDFAESWVDSTFSRTEQQMGAFAEYTFKRKTFTMVAGLRVDEHRPLGTFVSPRLHLKFDLGPLTALRASAGKAYRSPNLFVENTSYLVSSRQVVVIGTPQAEEAWNGGISLLHKFKWLDHKWAFNIDLYRTEFIRQLVTDVEDPGSVRFYMSEAPSFANTIQVDLQYEITRDLDLKLAYRYYEANTTYLSGQRMIPLAPKHRGLIDLAYESRNELWKADISLNLFGEKRIPDTREAFTTTSPSYATVFTQVTRIFGPLEVYVGAENLTNFLQNDQIIAMDDPFGPNFDASMIWGPVNGRMVYGGLRFTIERKPQQLIETP